MSQDQSRAPILEAIQAYHESGMIPFSPPGHKRDKGIDADTAAALGREVFRNDIPMLIGADDRRESKQVRKQAEQLAAAAYGAEESYFSVNGSSLSMHVAVMCLANPGDKVIVARNSHKSVIGALILAGVRPVFVTPEIDDAWNIMHGIAPQRLEETLNTHPDAKGVFVVSPTYYGVTSDLKTLAGLCHQRGIPFVVDEAWGAHFPFHPGLPPSGMESGADLCISSIHKTLIGLSQASIINKQGKLVPEDRFTLVFDLFQTTSPSSLILASCDAARRQMALHGEELWGRALELADHARAEFARIPGLKVLGAETTGKPGAHGMDRVKLALDVSGLGVSGWEAFDWLQTNCHVAPELVDQRHLVMLVNFADDAQTTGRLIEAVQAMAAWTRTREPKPIPPLPPLRDLLSELVMTPAEAFFAPAEHIPLVQAEGRVAAEMASPYPPGIPRILPGERIKREHIEFYKIGMQSSMFVLDSSDLTLQTIRVVA